MKQRVTKPFFSTMAALSLAFAAGAEGVRFNGRFAPSEGVEGGQGCAA